MDRNVPSGDLPRNPKVRNLIFKLAFGVFFLVFLSGLQPTLQFPPLKKAVVFAEESEQTKTVQANSVSFVFQLPHPGYISTHFSSYHPGIDLATGLGMPIKPITKGTVISSGYNFFGLGLVVEVDHGEGYRSLYAHMGKTYVQVGQEVDNNSLLGEVGLTGNTSGPHTHLEIYKDNKPINPITLLPTMREQPQPSDFVASGGKVSYSQDKNSARIAKVIPTPTPSPQVVEPVKPSLELKLMIPTPQPTIAPIMASILQVK